MREKRHLPRTPLVDFMTFSGSNADDFPVYSFWGYQESLLLPLCETMSGGGYVSSSFWRNILSGNKPRATRACIKSQRYGIHSSLKSALKCIKVYMQKMISKCQEFLISRVKYLAKKKSPWGHDGQGSDVYSIFILQQHQKPCLWISLLSENKNDYALFFPFFV